MATTCSPAFVFKCEMSIACTYALRHPAMALDAAWHAYDAAVKMRRPDLASDANDLMAAIVMGGVVTLTVEAR